MSTREASDKKTAAEEVGHEVIHGAGDVKSDHVDRADKTAPMPEIEKGSAIPGLGASGGGNAVEGSKGESGKRN